MTRSSTTSALYVVWYAQQILNLARILPVFKTMAQEALACALAYALTAGFTSEMHSTILKHAVHHRAFSSRRHASPEWLGCSVGIASCRLHQGFMYPFVIDVGVA
jgi:hypothetical protein